MNFLKIILFSLLTRSFFGMKEIDGYNLSTNTNQIRSGDVGEFLVKLIIHYHWGDIIVLAESNPHQLMNFFSTRFLPIVVHPTSKKLPKFNRFRTVILVNNIRSNFFDILVEMSDEPNSCPQNWLLITDEDLADLPTLFIPHEFNVIFAKQDQSNQITLSRVFSGKYDALLSVQLGYWEKHLKLLRVRPIFVPLPPLTNKTIRITTEELSPHFTPTSLKPNGIAPYGIYGEILHVLQTKMNFSYSVQRPFDKTFGVRINKTHFNGMVATLLNNQSDMIIVISITTDRKSVMDFSHMVTKITMAFIYKNQEHARWRFFFFLNPFSTGLWMSVLGIAVIVAILIFTHDEGAFTNKKQLRSKTRCMHVRSFMWYLQVSYYTLLRTGYDLQVSEATGKILLQTLHLFSIMIYIQYSSVLTSMLTVHDQPVPFKSLKELLDKSNYGVGTLHGSSVVEVYKSAKTAVTKGVWQRMQKHPERYFTKTIADGVELAYAEKCAYIMEKIVLADLIRGNCSLQFGEKEAFDVMFAFAYRKGFQYTRIFNKYLQLMVESGIVQKVEKKYTPPNHNKACELKGWHMGLERHSLVGIFVVMVLAIFLSLFVLSLEIFIDYCTFVNINNKNM